MNNLSTFEEWALLIGEMASVAEKINDDAYDLKNRIEDFYEFIIETDGMLKSGEFDFNDVFKKISEF